MPAKYYGNKKKTSSNKPAQPSSAPNITATGQFTPGALSSANAQTQKTSVGEQRTTNFVDLGGGKTGSVVDRTEPLIGLSDAFAAKASAAGVSVSQNPTGPGSIVTPGAVLPNPQLVPAGSGSPSSTIPQSTSPPVSLPTPPPFVPNAAEIAREKPKESIFGRNVDIAATKLLNKGFDLIQQLGNGDFQRGLYSLIVAPVAAAPGAVGSGIKATTAAKFMPGVVTKETLAKGGVKASKTITEALVKAFKPSKSVSSLKPYIVAGGVLWTISGIIKDSTGTGAIGSRDFNEEARGAADILLRDVQNDPIALQETLGLMDDIKNTKPSWLPFGIGASSNAAQYTEFMENATQIRLDHLARKQAIETSGISEQGNTAEFWTAYHAGIEANKTAEEKKRVDYYNSEKLRVEREIANARRDSDKATAAFWLDYQKQLADLAEQERVRQAEYWLEYKKMVLKLQDENGRSNLGFGLL